MHAPAFLLRLFGFAALLTPATGRADTVVNGVIGSDTVWSPTGSPYVITGDLTVDTGVTLTVAQGTVVRAAANSDALGGGLNTAKVELIVRGTLQVNGAAAAPVVFESNSGTPLRNHWYGIRTETAGVVNLGHAVVRHATHGLHHAAASTSTVADTTFATLNSYGLYLSGAGTLSAARVEITDASSYGVYVANPSGTLALSDSRVHHNSSYGLAFDGGQNHLVTRNRVYANGGIGVYVYLNNIDRTFGQLTYNTVHGNTSYGVQISRYSDTGALTVTNNLITQNGGTGLYVYRSSSDPVTTGYNDVWGHTTNFDGVTAGATDLSYNPLYLDAASGDFRLTWRSPGRFAGGGSTDLGALAYVDEPAVRIATLAGVLWEDTTLSLAGSPHQLAGDLIVAPGFTLTIDPGVVVQAAAGSDLLGGGTSTNRAELIVRGALDAAGLPGQRVILTSSAASPARNNWYGVLVADAGTATLTHTLVEWANRGLSHTGSGVVVADQTTVREQSGYGLYLSGSGTLSFAAGEVTGASSYGVYVPSPSGTLQLTRTRVHHNGSYGLAFDGGLAHQVENNLVHANSGIGVYVYLNNIDRNFGRLVNNTIHGNTSYGVQISRYSDTGALTVKNNLITQNGGTGLYVYRSSSDAVTTGYNDVWGHTTNFDGVTAGATDLSVNPLYLDAANGDLSLPNNSPVIDAADNSVAPPVDFVGNVRPQPRVAGNTPIADQGAFEYSPLGFAVTGTSPNVVGQNATGVAVDVLGAGFAAGDTVSFSGAGVTVSGTQFVGAGVLRATISVAAGAPLGARDVTVNKGGSSATGSAVFLVDPAPTLSGIAPSTVGQGASGVTIQLTGTGFKTGASLSFSVAGVTASNVVVSSPTQLGATLAVDGATPVGALGVTVVNGDHGRVTAAGLLAITAAPTLTLLTPNKGNQSSAALPLTLGGTGFAAGAQVAVLGAGVTPSGVTVVSATRIDLTLAIAAGAALGLRDVTVTNPDGGRAIAAGAFKVTTNPVITSISPTSADAPTSGLFLNVFGDRFDNGAAVQLSGSGLNVVATQFIHAQALRATVDIFASAPGGTRDVRVINPDGGEAVYPASFSINSTAQPDLAAAPTSVALAAGEGQAPTPTLVTVTNVGTSTLSWTVDADEAWVTLAPAAGTGNGTFALGADTTGLTAAGSPYSAVVTVRNADNPTDSQPIAVTLTLSAAAPLLEVWPSTLDFVAEEGGEPPAEQSLVVSLSSGGPWSVLWNAPWLRVTPTSGSGNETLSVEVDATGLDAADSPFAGSITVLASGATGSPATVDVTLSVSEALPRLWVAPRNLEFAALAGGASPAAQPVVVRNRGGGALNWTASWSAAWLDLDYASGTLAAGEETTLTVTLTSTGLPGAGSPYGETIVFAAAGAAGSPAPLPVVLTLSEGEPIANAGSDQELPPSLVQLDGSRSLDPYGAGLSYAWTQSDGPVSVTLQGATTASPRAVLRRAGTYLFVLAITDGDAAGDLDEVSITITNSAPVADAGPGQRRSSGATVRLDGSLSLDANGDPLTYLWEQQSGPVVLLDDAQTARPTLTPVQAGVYTFRLRAHDGELWSPPALTQLIVDQPESNVVPVADAGPDQTAEVGATVRLDGSGSIDSDDTPLAYTWQQASGPTVTLDRSDVVAPTFVAGAPGVIRLRLTVNDGVLESPSDEVTVVIDTAGGASLPLADAGPPQTVTRLDPVTLDGTSSTDPNGDPLSYAWRQTAGATLAMSGIALAQPGFVPITTGLYGFGLTVSDGTATSLPATTHVVVEEAGDHLPVANAGAALTAQVGATVELDGRASTDADGDPLAFHWLQTGGAPVTLTGPDTARPAFVPARAGVFRFTLWVHDGAHRSLPATAQVTVEPAPDEPRPPVGGAEGKGCDCQAAPGAALGLAGLALLLRRRRR